MITKYHATVETVFDGEANCAKCGFCFQDDCSEEWCGLTGNDLVLFKQHWGTMQGYTEKQFEGKRPTWCPLVEVEL
jgi:hypothetical protein